MSYELTDNDHLMISMRGGLYEAANMTKNSRDDAYKAGLERVVYYMNNLEPNLQVTFTMTSNKLIDEHTGIAFAERNGDGKWIIIEGWLEALNNA